ncbi:hypothetical protein JL722_11313 [Aureococcus anophagefferens]|nr:hypothetical protein JL722_11313 [Aureococcus anophagefferens]
MPRLPPLDGSESFFDSLSHLQDDVEAGGHGSEFEYLQKIEVNEHISSHVEFKLRRDMLCGNQIFNPTSM